MPGAWGYTKDNGPHTWNEVAPAGKGKRQSPIDIKPAECQFDPALNNPKLNWKYTPHNAQQLINNGASAQITYESSGSELAGGPLADKYKVAQFHLHWGKTADTGSEHRIDDKMFAAELHIVHYNADKYATFGEAADKSDGLCVLGIFLKSGAAKDHLGLKKMTDLLKEVPNAGDSMSVSGGFDPMCVLPNDTDKYWTYLGSLTTPPLYESVTWIVFKDPIDVTEAQMNAFRSMNQNKKDEPQVQDEFDGKICENYRPPQPLHDRVVRASFQ
uniref:Carbonic anhydrase n=1 Tax=Hydroides elegans TaxID=216498 RepID=A0A191ZDL3_HYDEL|nr:carbonic anhydrase [Hydroides elegans]